MGFILLGFFSLHAIVHVYGQSCANIPQPVTPIGSCQLAADCSSLVCTMNLGFGMQQTFSIILEHCSFVNAFGADPYVQFATSGSLGGWSYKETCKGGVCSLNIPIFPANLLNLVFSLQIQGNLAKGAMSLTSLGVTILKVDAFTLLLDDCPFYATVYFAYGALGGVVVLTVAWCCYRRRKNAQIKLAYVPQVVPSYSAVPSGPQSYLQNYSAVPRGPQPIQVTTSTPALQLPLNQFEAAIVQFYTERNLWDKISKAPMIAKQYLHNQTEFWNQVYAKYPLQQQQQQQQQQQPVSIPEQKDDSDSDSDEGTSKTPLLNSKKQKNHKKKSRKQKQKAAVNITGDVPLTQYPQSDTV